MITNNQQPTPTDRQLLAREDALDKFSGRYNFDRRADWCTGWDAAMEYVEQERQLQAEAQIIQDAMDGRIK